MTYTEVENGIYDWASSIIAVSVIFADDNGPRPSLPYITINVTTTVKVGQANKEFPIPDTGIQKIRYNEDVSLSLNGYGVGANDQLQLLKDSLQKESVRDTLRVDGLVIRDDSTGITDISTLIDETIEKRWLFEIFMGFGQEITEDTSYIEDVDMTENYIPPRT